LEMNMNKQQLGLIALSLVLALPAHAQSDNASQAGKHSALAAGHSAVAGTQVVSAAVAVPLVIVGAAGTVSGQAGEALLEHAFAPQPLEISDEVIVADPAPRHLRHDQETAPANNADAGVR
jgi:hypothetical protein